MLALAMLLAAAAPLQVAPLAPSPVSGPSAEASAKATRLTSLTHPTSTMRRLNLGGWESANRASLSLQPQLLAIEKQYPGALAAAVDAARPLAQAQLETVIERSRKRRVEMLARRLTSAELDEAIRFFSGPGGRLMAGIWDSIDLRPVAGAAAKSAVEDGKAEISAEAMNRTGQAAARKGLGKLTAEDSLAVMRFEASANGRKYLALQPELDALDYADANQPDPTWIARQEAVMRAAILAFTESGKPATVAPKG